MTAVPPIPIAVAFDAYAKQFLPSNATLDQVTTARQAFYEAIAFLLAMFYEYVGDDAVSEEAGQAYLSALHEECERFHQAAGRTTARDPREALGRMQYTTPDPDQIANTLRELGHAIGVGVPPGYGYVLLIFTFGGPGSMFYISNGEREDMIKAMREFIQKQTQ